jgi:hypothetical protein
MPCVQGKSSINEKPSLPTIPTQAKLNMLERFFVFLV